MSNGDVSGRWNYSAATATGLPSGQAGNKNQQNIGGPARRIGDAVSSYSMVPDPSKEDPNRTKKQADVTVAPGGYLVDENNASFDPRMAKGGDSTPYNRSFEEATAAITRKITATFKGEGTELEGVVSRWRENRLETMQSAAANLYSNSNWAAEQLRTRPLLPVYTQNPSLDVVEPRTADKYGHAKGGHLAELHEVMLSKNVQLPVDQLSPESSQPLVRTAIVNSHQMLLQMGLNMKDSAGLSHHIANMRTGVS